MEVLMGKSSINGQFSMAMLNNQRVYIYIYISPDHPFKWLADLALRNGETFWIPRVPKKSPRRFWWWRSLWCCEIFEGGSFPRCNQLGFVQKVISMDTLYGHFLKEAHDDMMIYHGIFSLFGQSFSQRWALNSSLKLQDQKLYPLVI